MATTENACEIVTPEDLKTIRRLTKKEYLETLEDWEKEEEFREEYKGDYIHINEKGNIFIQEVENEFFPNSFIIKREIAIASNGDCLTLKEKFVSQDFNKTLKALTKWIQQDTKIKEIENQLDELIKGT